MAAEEIERRIAEVLTRDRSNGLCPLDGPCVPCDCFDPLHEYERANAKAVMAEVVAPELVRAQGEIGRLHARIKSLEGCGEDLLRRAERAESAAAAVQRLQDVYHEFFSNGLKRDEFTYRLRSKLFEALYGEPRSDSIWLNEISPTQHRAEKPHQSCGREEGHEAHAWRGTRREFGGVAEVYTTLWCEDAAILAAPEATDAPPEG